MSDALLAVGQQGNRGTRRRALPLAWRVPPRFGALSAGLVLPLAALLLWAASSHAGWLPQQVLPAPELAWSSLMDMWRSGDLARDAGISLGRVAQGFLLGAEFGLLLGTAMGLSRTVEGYLRPSFTALAQVPTIGWMPLLMLPLGIGEPLKLAIIAKTALVPVTLNTRDGIRAVPRA